ncbi:cilia- and flagella-associated protein 52 isoform X2 [Phaenicophaeus curvirostris]|uniref:cilia- and flagella-associated protein 52 isoform X2 n=1 Tax=Phaenicophaeus curvirostris TaxID=33595 RepID=UPI0037F0C655
MAAEAAGGIELLAAIGYNGHIHSGLTFHPDEKHILYPLGCTVVVQELGSQKQTFLRGHMSDISCLSVSRDGQYVASGEATSMNCKAEVILWDFQQKKLLARLSLHKGRIEGLAFSPSSLYLMSLGGQDDGSGTMRVWELDSVKRNIHPTECRTAQLKRMFTCVKIADDDSYFYVGTTSGDILKVNTNTKVMASYGPAKKTFSSGVTALLLLTTGDLIVGTGGGIVALLKTSNYRVMKKISVQGAVTSLTCGHQGRQFFVGTNECQIYHVNVVEFKEELITTCHNEAVQDIVFPLGVSDLFATCSKNDIRVWHTPEHKELLRIVVPNGTCHAIDILSDGNSIISAWDDGIRSFTARTGRLIYMINHAHRLGVTAIAATNDCKRIVSGGGEGQVKIWNIHEKSQKLGEILKVHTSAVSCIKIKKDDQEFITASLDGTCMIWDIVQFVRKQMIQTSRFAKCVCYHPEGYQIITCGADRKIRYWEVFDGSEVREVEGCISGSINGMDITSDGACFVTGGDDHLVKLWDYIEGAVTHVGVGHSGSITRLKICPGKKYIVSVSADGAILVWKYPGSH